MPNTRPQVTSDQDLYQLALQCRDLSALLEDTLIELDTETCEKKLDGITALSNILQERMEKLAHTCDPVTLRNILAGSL
ncbi:hypothetical protein [Celeribacter litoreus]|uniref:hypothetical protein n=1 Tax=Celeribacter litoreus TaxID=2876714 RepID=UPI001CD03784|nr:hypothetical protein [Celeribacter litoreus]MCA0042220.1 hypothetical protein [Celeribacter litoreus]